MTVFPRKARPTKRKPSKIKGTFSTSVVMPMGNPPQIVAQQGKTRQPAGCKVGTLGKIADAQGIQKPGDQIIQLIRYKGLRFFFYHRTLPLFWKTRSFSCGKTLLVVWLSNQF